MKAEVVAFKSWADEELEVLKRMGLTEAIADGAEMPDDPQLVASMRKMLGIPDPQPGHKPRD